jgi:hypothetical protein
MLQVNLVISQVSFAIFVAMNIVAGPVNAVFLTGSLLDTGKLVVVDAKPDAAQYQKRINWQGRSGDGNPI